MYTIKDVSVILPYTREDGAMKCIKELEALYPDVEIISEYDPDRIGVANMIAKLTAKTTRQLVCFMADDTFPLPGFLEESLRSMEALPDGWGLVGLKTSDSESARAGHWLAHKNLLPLLDGEFHYTGYQHCYGSDEFTDRALEMGRYAKAWDAKIVHDNPVIYGGDFSHDKLLVDVYGEGGSRDEDKKLYHKRKRARLNRFAIAAPLVSEMVHAQFWMSFACMDKPSEYLLLVPEFPHGPWSTNIADARNSLIGQALDCGVSKLLMVDTDQTYPSDTITKLLSHDVDICGVRVHSRWEPYSPIFYRGTIGAYKFISNDEMYSGDLIEIDATGTGCLMINMEIFDELEYPWFQFTMVRDRPVGEDIYFCHKAREAGFKIFVDSSIGVGHLATIEIDEALHKLYQKIHGEKK